MLFDMTTTMSNGLSPTRNSMSENTLSSQTITIPEEFGTSFLSPTDSEFSDLEEDVTVQQWDAAAIDTWLEEMDCGQYSEAFKENNITGEHLLELDSAMLKELGIKRLGDRLRIAKQLKHFREQRYKRLGIQMQKSIAELLYLPPRTPPSSDSPQRTDDNSDGLSPRIIFDDTSAESTPQYAIAMSIATPPSPTKLEDPRCANSSLSPTRTTIYDGDEVLYSPAMNGSTATIASIKSPQLATAVRVGTFTKAAAAAGARSDVKFVQDASAKLDKAFIKVIYDDGKTSILNLEGTKTAEDVVVQTLKKGKLNEGHVKSYCFYSLEGTDAIPSNCRRLTEAELMRICTDVGRHERERLMFRKIHAGEPDGEQLATAARIATQHLQQSAAVAAGNSASRSQLKIQKLTGEPLPSLSYPMSPSSAAQRERYQHASELQNNSTPRPPTGPALQDFLGGRPPSELVAVDVDTYFPDADRAEIESIRRMSTHRSKRLSRAASRLSVVSTFSVSNLNKDVPPVPGIPVTWQNNNTVMARARPLSVYSTATLNPSDHRNSMASFTTLGPVNEESPSGSSRKSYISFSAESIAEASSATSPTRSVADPFGTTVSKQDAESTISSDHSATETGGSTLQEQLRQAIAEDGEEPDEALTEFLQPDAYTDMKFIRGRLIGQGSFGNVYMALHSVTAEIMAVKQVELPHPTSSDTKRKAMVDALKHEIALLRSLSHPHIVRYLGSSSDDANLNIFLEYVSGGSISRMLKDYGAFNEPIIIKFVYQILDGLKYLHSNNIIHRDIKGANILVDNAGTIKISDFGISKRVQDSRSYLSSESLASLPSASKRGSLQGSVFWMAPEVVRQTAYTRKADIWSLGCLVVEMLTGNHPHPTLSQMQAIFKIGGGGKAVEGVRSDPKPEMPEAASEEAKDFLERTFREEFERRPEAEELLETAFVRKGMGLVYGV